MEWLHTTPDGHTSTGASSSDMQKGWPFVVNAAANYCDDEVAARTSAHQSLFLHSSSLRRNVQNISTATIYFAIRLMPPTHTWEGMRLKDLCAVSASMLRTQHGRPVHFESTFEFLKTLYIPMDTRSRMASDSTQARHSTTKEAAVCLRIDAWDDCNPSISCSV
jgi:hypothetical protein